MSQTKRVVHDAKFIRAATASPTEALAYMLMSSFGINLSIIVGYVEEMITQVDGDAILLCVTAGTQIRGNVTFVGQSYGGMRANYPMLFIDSQRETGDSFNFSALHVAGHVICSLVSHALASKVLAKAGNCVTGKSFPSNSAGKINGDIAASWTPEELNAFTQYANNLTQNDKLVITNVLDASASNSVAFVAKLKQ